MAFYLEPEEGGKRVCLPSGRTTLGRGPLLEVKYLIHALTHMHIYVLCLDKNFCYDFDFNC